MREEIKVNEASVVESISTRNRALKASIPEESPPKESEPEAIEEPLPENKALPRREPSKRKRGQPDKIEDVFLKRKEIKNRQSVYISQEVQSSIARLVHVLALSGNEISVGGYIDNVLAEHLESHKEAIAELYRKQLDHFL